ncbi:MAG: restriction endonuclease subunit S [Desulfotalea sp.]
MSAKYQAYPEYKDSEVEWLGDIPSVWEVAKVKYTTELTPKKPSLDRSLKCSFVPMEKLKTDSLRLDENCIIDKVYDGYTYFAEGDILLAKVTPCFENKNIAVANKLTNKVGFGSSEIYTLRPSIKVDTRFLFFRLQEDGFIALGAGEMTGAGGLKRVPATTIENFSYATPPLTEQTTIANFLDHETAKIDLLIEKQERLIELLQEKRQAVISHAVTKGLNPDAPMKDSEVEWLGEVPCDWIVSKFSYVKKVLTDFTANGSFADLKSNVIYRDKPSYARLIRLTDLRVDLNNDNGVWIDEKAYHYLNKSALFGGEFLMANVGAYAGLFYQMPFNKGNASLAPNMFMAKFDDRKTIREFMAYVGESYCINQQLTLSATASSAQPKLNKDNFKSVQFTYPLLDIQRKIANFLDHETAKIDKLVKKGNQAVDLLKERRTALISAAVTGKIDLRNWQAPTPNTSEDN